MHVTASAAPAHRRGLALCALCGGVGTPLALIARRLASPPRIQARPFAAKIFAEKI